MANQECQWLLTELDSSLILGCPLLDPALPSVIISPNSVKCCHVGKSCLNSTLQSHGIDIVRSRQWKLRPSSMHSAYWTKTRLSLISTILEISPTFVFVWIMHLAPLCLLDVIDRPPTNTNRSHLSGWCSGETSDLRPVVLFSSSGLNTFPLLPHRPHRPAFGPMQTQPLRQRCSTWANSR